MRPAIRSVIGASILLAGCSASPWANEDGASGPVMSYELDGTWCTTATPDEICLTVRQTDATARYWFTLPTCQETGYLAGGLEFTPDTTSRLCLAPEYGLYSAQAHFSGPYLILELDQSPQHVKANQDGSKLTLEMSYVSYQSD